mgnify:CR=1 FL=1
MEFLNPKKKKPRHQKNHGVLILDIQSQNVCVLWTIMFVYMHYVGTQENIFHRNLPGVVTLDIQSKMCVYCGPMFVYALCGDSREHIP